MHEAEGVPLHRCTFDIEVDAKVNELLTIMAKLLPLLQHTKHDTNKVKIGFETFAYPLGDLVEYMWEAKKRKVVQEGSVRPQRDQDGQLV